MVNASFEGPRDFEAERRFQSLLRPHNETHELIRDRVEAMDISPDSSHPLARAWGELGGNTAVAGGRYLPVEKIAGCIKANADFIKGLQGEPDQQAKAKELAQTVRDLEAAYNFMVDDIDGTPRARDLTATDLTYEQMDAVLGSIQFLHDQSFYIKDVERRLEDKLLDELHHTVQPIYVGRMYLSEKLADTANKIAGDMQKAQAKKLSETFAFGKTAKRVPAVNLDEELENYTKALETASPAQAVRLKDELEVKERVQILGEAAVTASLFELFSTKPDCSPDDVRALVLNARDRYGLGEAYMGKLETAVKNLVAKHQAVRSLYTRHGGNSQAIFAEVFGFMPQEEVEIKQGPATIYFRMKGESDYVRADMAGREDKGAVTMYRSMSAGGMYLRNFPRGAAYEGCFMIENPVSWANQPASEAKFKHELQHFWQKLIPRESMRDLWETRLVESARNPRLVREAVNAYFSRYRMVSYDWYVSEEIDAYLAAGEAPEKVYQRLTKGRKAGGLYDYYGFSKETSFKKREAEKNDFLLEGGVSPVARAQKILGGEYTALIEEERVRVFEERYRAAIKEGIGAYQTLLDNGFSHQEASGILVRRPLTTWKQVVEGKLKLQEAKINSRNFNLTVGDKVIVDIDGHIESGFVLTGYDRDTKQAVLEGYRLGIPFRHEMNYQSLKGLNIPQKRLIDWLDLWIRSGGKPDPKAFEGLDLDFESGQQRLSASEAVNIFRTLPTVNATPTQVLNVLVEQELKHRQKT